MAKTLDIKIDQGATFEMIVTMKDSLSAAFDITGYEFEGQIRESVSASTAAAAFEAELLPQTGATLGQVRLFIPATATAAIPIVNQTAGDRTVAKFLYDISYIDTDENEYRLMQGQALVSPEVTR